MRQLRQLLGSKWTLVGVILWLFGVYLLYRFISTDPEVLMAEAGIGEMPTTTTVYRRHSDVTFVYAVGGNDSNHAAHRGSKLARDKYRQLRQCSGDGAEFVSLTPSLDVYAVYWDPRRNDFDNVFGTHVYLRIVAAWTPPVWFKSSEDLRSQVHCLFAGDANAPVDVQASYHKLHFELGDIHGGYIFSCLVPPPIYGLNRLKQPCRVLLYAAGRSPVAIKIINTVPFFQQRDFTVCTLPLYGDILDGQIVEFMEFSRYLGASHVMFYDDDLSPEARSVLNYYVRIKQATVLPWRRGTEDILDAVLPKYKHNQPPLLAITDCLYRNMALSRYVMFVDLSEFVVPYARINWYDMLSRLGTDDTCAFRVSGVFFDPHLQGRLLEESASQLPTLMHTWRTRRSSQQQSRCIIKPLWIFEAGLVEVRKPLLRRYVTETVDYPVALVHHHRACQADSDIDCVDLVRDDVVSKRYFHELHARVAQKLQHFAKFAQRYVRGDLK